MIHPQTRLNKLHVGDARHLYNTLRIKESSVDVTVTSPPYWNRKNYGAENQIGFGQSLEAYLDDVQEVFAQCYKLTKETGSLWLIADDYRDGGVLHLLPWALAERARAAGWTLRDQIVWDKQHTLPFHGKGQMRNVTESILFMTKSNDYKYHIDRVKVIDELSKWWVDFPERFNPKGKTPTNIWTFPIMTQGTWCKPSELDHECPFPPGLIARILEISTDSGDLVLDPFAGSGVTLAQASAMDRRYVGTEINPVFVKMFNDTVIREVAVEWQARQAFRIANEGAFSAQDFERTVMRLRALKYARQATKPFTQESSGARTDVLAIICLAQIPLVFRRDQGFPVTIWILLSEASVGAQEALQETIRRSTQPPLSQYGVVGEILCGTADDLKLYLSSLSAASLKNFHETVSSDPSPVEKNEDNPFRWQDISLSLYPDYRPRKFTDQKTASLWTDAESSIFTTPHKKVPMLSNIQVDVAWVMEET